MQLGDGCWWQESTAREVPHQDVRFEGCPPPTVIIYNLPMAKNDLILGTAGHIDHGKTTLIRALTGVQTDRLPEEQKRGITIELGFANLEVDDFRFGIVDVPGHEKFVRTMLAGATGMDLAMLVVAADDSVKQQTREHLDILRLLQLPAGVIALTKCDLVDADWLDLVEEEIKDLVADTPLSNAAIIRTSAVDGSGIPELIEKLKEAAQLALEHRSASVNAPFRMAIDRSFSIDGHGTVVTGSVVSGSVSVGEELEVVPGNKVVRVRGLQNHDSSTEEVRRGQRAAINLAGLHHAESERGQELIQPGSLAPSQIMTVRLRHLATMPRPLKDRSRVRLHLGTMEQLATLRLLESSTLEAGNAALAQLRIPEPVVASWRQPFVLRFESPVETIGGGIVLDPEAAPIKQATSDIADLLEKLEQGNARERIAAAVFLRGLRPWGIQDLFRLTGIEDSQQSVNELVKDGTFTKIEISPQRSLTLHSEVLVALGVQIESVLERLHDDQPLRLVFAYSEIGHRFDYLPDPKVFQHAVGVLRKQKKLRSSDKGIGLSARGPKLSQNEIKLLDQLVISLREAGATPPTIKQLEEQTVKNRDSVRQLLQLGAGQGDLVEVSKEYYYHSSVIEQLWEKLLEAFKQTEGLTVSAIKDELAFSRKFAVPFCEFLDREGYTRRDGDLRFPIKG